MKTLNRFYTNCIVTLLGMLLITSCGGSGGGSGIVPTGLRGEAQSIETDDIRDADSHQIVFDAKGNALAVWHQYDGIRKNIWANHYVAGRGWGNADRIENSNAGEARFPQIAMDAAGNALAVWSQSDGTRYNIWANRYVAGSWGSAELVETNDSSDAFSPQIAIDAAGNGLAVWEQYDGRSFNAWANRYVAGSWGIAKPIESDNADNAYSH